MEQDNQSISWNSLPWKKFQRKSFRLERKIYQAKHSGDYKSFKRLQKLLIKSKSIYYLFVKEIANYYANKGIFLSQKMKMKLVDNLHIRFNKCKCFINNNILKKSLVFLSLGYLKNEVAICIWKFILDLRHCEGIFRITKKSVEIVSKFLKFTSVNDAYKEKFKSFLNISNLNSLKLGQCNNSILSLRSLYTSYIYKDNVFRLWKPQFREFYLSSSFLIKSNLLDYEESKFMHGFI